MPTFLAKVQHLLNIDMGWKEEPQLVRYLIGDCVTGERGTEGGNTPCVQGEVASGWGGGIRDGPGGERGK